MLYISSLKIVDLLCFPGETVIELRVPSSDQRNAGWNLILGNNGTGKTSLLRIIALGLCNATESSGLLMKMPGNLIRSGCKTATIEINLLANTEPAKTCQIKTTFRQTKDGCEAIDQTTNPQNLSRSELFACGYGAAMRTIGNEAFKKSRLIDSMYSLFNYEARLQNPETALYRVIQTEKITQPELLKLVDQGLNLPQGSTSLTVTGLKVSGPWGKSMPLKALGDGYLTTLALICDLLGWSLLHTEGESSTEVKGIVLIDMLENHLHPSRQQTIAKQLAEIFPGIQFVATTHAPLTVIGAADLPEEQCQLILLELSESKLKVTGNLSAPHNRRADQVLTSNLFNLLSPTNDRVTRDVAE